MRVVLVSMPVRLQVPNLVAPHGLMHLAAYLEQRGHEVYIVDNALLRESHDRIACRVADLAPQLIGVGGIVTAYGHAIHLTRALKRAAPRVPVVLGGQVLIDNVENCFRNMAIDHAIHGYGEIALQKLTEHLDGNLPAERIPGLSWTGNGCVVSNPGREFFRHVDDMPFPAYHLVDMDHYTRTAAVAVPGRRVDVAGKVGKDPRGMMVMGTLGCTDRCTFCVHEQEFVGLKRHSNEWILDHLRRLHAEHGVNYFIMGEEMFISNFQQAREFNALMNQELPDCVWSATTRADQVTPELIAELEGGSCVGLHWGYEAGSQKILDLMQKRMSVSINERAYWISEEAGLVGSLSFMVGNVGETNTTIRETTESIARAGINQGTVFYVSAYPGGRVWNWAVERGIIKDTHAYLHAVSNVDPEHHINVNLTPYPDFVLKAWKKMVSRAIYEQALRRLPEPESAAARRGLKRRIRGFLGRRVLPWLVDLYFAYRGVRTRIFKTRRDRRHEYRQDKRGALLPDNLVVAKPQRHLSSNELAVVWERKPERISLERGAQRVGAGSSPKMIPRISSPVRMRKNL